MKPQDHTATISELEVILSESKVEKKQLFEKPYLWGVTYANPNPDGSTKNCKNCSFWVTTQNCILHKRDLPVSGDSVCGYHLSGKPRAEWLQLEGANPLDPVTSGLEAVEGGTSCGGCVFYRGDDKGGYCGGVVDKEGEPAAVMALGCCSRWEKK